MFSTFYSVIVFRLKTLAHLCCFLMIRTVKNRNDILFVLFLCILDKYLKIENTIKKRNFTIKYKYKHRRKISQIKEMLRYLPFFAYITYCLYKLS